jgi:hypothetical protein
MFAAKHQLEGIMHKKLSAAVDHRDHNTILCFIGIYSPLGLKEEGLQVYLGYLKKVIAMRARLEEGGGGGKKRWVLLSCNEEREWIFMRL